jgi:hypothetical protein
MHMKYRTIAGVFIAVALLLVCSVPSVTSAQSDTAAVRAMYQTSATVPTNLPGVRRFSDPPAGFDAVSASDTELASYGFLPRPDAQADPNGYARWVRAMKMARNHWTGDLKETGKYHLPNQQPKVVAASASGMSNSPNSSTSQNWSGVILTNTLSKYNTKTSFYLIESYFNVPFAQEAFSGDGNICDGTLDDVSVWDGFDGSGLGKAGNNDLLQAGTQSDVSCSNGKTTTAKPFAWWEWYPDAEVQEFDVTTGDDMLVGVIETSSTTAVIFLQDLTHQVYDTLDVTAPSGTELVGSSAEWIVERTCCETGTDHTLPLANYVMEFTYGAEATNNENHVFYPGNQTTTTYLSTMLDGSNAISYPVAGTTGSEGNEGITFFEEGCAMTGGC